MYELWIDLRLLVILNRHPEGGRFVSGVRLKDLVSALLRASLVIFALPVTRSSVTLPTPSIPFGPIHPNLA
jgi:hypothetical protein